MGINVTTPNNGSDYVEFKNAAGTSLAKVGGYDDGSSNGHVEIYTTAAGTPTERVRIDSSGNVGIGTSSPSNKLEVQTSGGNGAIETAASLYYPASYGGGSSGSRLVFKGQNVSGTKIDYAGAWMTINNSGAGTENANLMFGTANNGTLTERMRIDSSGNLLVGKTSSSTSTTGVEINRFGTVQAICPAGLAAYFGRTDTGSVVNFYANTTTGVGSISVTGSATAYNTSSDYRLKESIQPMQNALGVVAQLNPVTYTWKADGSDGQGFIAHELQAVVPDCVTGEKDAVDAEGKPVYQGIDTSFLVATLTKAIQEQQAQIETLTARIAALEAK